MTPLNNLFSTSPQNRLALVALVSSVLVGLLALYVVFRVLRRLEQYHWLRGQKRVTLEITPLAIGNRTINATEHLFMVMHGLKRSQKLRDRLLGHEPTITAEHVSTKSDGIRFVMHASATNADRLEQMLHSYLPSVEIKRIKNPSAHIGYSKVVTFKQTGHYAFPTALFRDLEEKDPLAYVTGALTKLMGDEQATVQLVISPVIKREARLLSRKILMNGDLLNQLATKQQSFSKRLVSTLTGALFGIIETAISFMDSSSRSHTSRMERALYDEQQVSKRLKPQRTLSIFEQEVLGSMQTKLSQPLFEVTIRAAVHSKESNSRLAAISAAMEAYTVPAYQQLKARYTLPHLQRYLRDAFHDGLPAFRRSRRSVLSSSELAALYHFPPEQASKAENVVQNLSRNLPAPVSLKNGTKFDVVLGMNQYHGTHTKIGLTSAERERHVYIIGGTGNGKTTLLQYSIVQDMQNGKGLAVIDPHGDMAETMLKHVPAGRVDDVIYFNPDDIGYPIGLNILELPQNISGDDLIREKDLITESVISIFRKIFSDDDSGGHRVEYVLRNTIQTALTVPDSTLFTIYELLNDPTYRKKVIAKLANADLKNFWKHELGKAGEMQRVKMSAGITAKIGRFLFSASAKRILEQPKSTIDFDDIINSGKILICNFSKGLVGEDTSELFGITVLAKLQLASLRRARIEQTSRRPFYLYVDEFQNFATQSFVQMLSESRKYKMFMIMAEQSTSQQKDKDMVNVVLANAGTIISFRTGNPEDEKLMLPLFIPFLEPGEIANLAPYNFFARLSATTSQEPLSGMTLLLEDGGSDAVAAEVIERSRLLHTGDKPLITETTLDIESDEDDSLGGAHEASPEDVFSS